MDNYSINKFQSGNQIRKMQTAAGGPIKYISDMYQKLSDSPVASTIYDGTNLALYAASPFTGGITLIPAMAMTGLQAAGASANIYDKGLNFQNGIDIASAVPGFGLLNKGVKLAMKPTMKMVGKTTKRVKSATKYLPKKESRPYTYRRMERVGNSGSRRVIRPVEHTIELGRYHPTFWQLAKEDKKYWPAAVLVYGEDAINHGLNTYQVIKDIDQKKQGGKMNILEFLKNGSGIYIKEKNKGKFTSYCGGKVTDECIRKAKASGNPTLVKRATFAANARKWKHKNGGIIVKAADGTKTNLFQKVGNFLNSDLGKTVGTGLINAFSSWTSSNKQNNAIDSQIEGLKKQNKADINSIQNWALQKATEEITQKFNEQQQLFNSGASFEQPSPIVFEHLKSQLANKYAQQAINDANLNSQEAIANLESQKTNPTSDIFSSLANVGIDYLSNKFANKALSKNGVPSSRNASFYSNPYLKTQNKVGTINSDGSMNTGIGGTTYNWKTNTFGSNNSLFKSI